MRITECHDLQLDPLRLRSSQVFGIKRGFGVNEIQDRAQALLTICCYNRAFAGEEGQMK